MKVILLNGSPRKNWNTHRMLLEAERGARETGADTELFHLFDLNCRDCMSCFACKRKGNRTCGVCAIRDDLRPILEKVAAADGVIIGSPVYFGNLTAQALAFINRMLFPAFRYESDPETGRMAKQIEGTKKCGLILTMNASEAYLNSAYAPVFRTLEQSIGGTMGSCETVCACDTYQFTNYADYYAGWFDAEKKAAHRDAQFPIDLQNACEMGKRIAAQ